MNQKILCKTCITDHPSLFFRLLNILLSNLTCFSKANMPFALQLLSNLTLFKQSLLICTKTLGKGARWPLLFKLQNMTFIPITGLNLSVLLRQSCLQQHAIFSLAQNCITPSSLYFYDGYRMWQCITVNVQRLLTYTSGERILLSSENTSGLSCSSSGPWPETSIHIRSSDCSI